jgi:hypothetical protein
MDWQAALRARLLAAAPVTALVGQRVYWVERPQKSALPAITLLTVSDGREQHLKGFDGLQSARVQIDVWAENRPGEHHGYSKVREVTEAVIAALVPAAEQGSIQFSRSFVDSLRDLSERTETQTIFRSSMDLIVHHTTA